MRARIRLYLVGLIADGVREADRRHSAEINANMKQALAHLMGGHR